MGNRIFGILWNLLRGAELLVSGLYQQSRQGLPGSQRFSKPTLLHFLTNDAREAGCTPCNNRRQQAREMISLSVLGKMLKDPLFQKIRQVNLTGGETTQRPDLHGIGAILVKKLPALETVRLVINATDTEQTWKQINALQEILQAVQKTLVVEVSLDGVEEIFDNQRGVEGNFESAVRIIQALKNLEIPFSVSSTLTPFNCYYADDLLLWFERQGIDDFNFRVAVESLHDHNQGDKPQNIFSANQKFHLVGFFDYLASRKTKDTGKRYYYQSLVDQLAFGSPRKAACIWQTNNAVTLDSHGNLRYCPVHSPPLGALDGKNGSRLFRENLEIHQQIITDKCAHCKYYGYAELPPSESIRYGKRLLSSPFAAGVQRFKKLVSSPPAIHKVNYPKNDRPQNWTNVLVTGWYGTETTGDKAILGELIYQLKTYQPDVKITLTTIDPKVSRQTNREMGYDDIELVDLRRAHDPKILAKMDAVLIGGGPLMEVRQIEHIWKIFRRANKARISRVIFGCGVGPIYSQKMKAFIGGICKLATAGFYRDQPSYNYAVKLGGNPDLKIACDPSLGFLSRWRELATTIRKGNDRLCIKGLLREQTRDYLAGSNLEESNARFMDNFCITLNQILRSYPDASIELMAMHKYWKGNDDRMFNRRVLKQVQPGLPVSMVRDYLDIYSHLERLQQADLTIAMRYHGHLFSLALGIPFLSINYSGKNGKVANLVQALDYQDHVEEYAGFTPGTAVEKLFRLVENRSTIRRALLDKTDNMIAQLERTYTEMWGASA